MSLSDRERAEGFRGRIASSSDSSEHYKDERDEGFRGGLVYISTANRCSGRDAK
jgi:hypothetical protein